MPTVLTFVNSHLAAFDEMVERRNTDFHDLSSRLLFRQHAGPNAEAPAESLPHPDASVFETDVLFWLGGWWTPPPTRIYYVLNLSTG